MTELTVVRPHPNPPVRAAPAGPPKSTKFQRPNFQSRIHKRKNPIVIKKYACLRLDKRECCAMLRAVK